MRNISLLVLFITMGGRSALAVGPPDFPALAAAECGDAKPLTKLVAVPVVRSCDKDDNGVNDCVGRNPYQCSMHCKGLEGVDLDRSMRMPIARGDNTCARENLKGVLLWKGAVVPGNDRLGDAYLDPRKPLPGGVLLFGAYTDRVFYVDANIDYCDRALGDLGRCGKERDALKGRLTAVNSCTPGQLFNTQTNQCVEATAVAAVTTQPTPKDVEPPPSKDGFPWGIAVAALVIGLLIGTAGGEFHGQGRGEARGREEAATTPPLPAENLEQARRIRELEIAANEHVFELRRSDEALAERNQSIVGLRARLDEAKAALEQERAVSEGLRQQLQMAQQDNTFLRDQLERGPHQTLVGIGPPAASDAPPAEDVGILHPDDLVEETEEPKASTSAADVQSLLDQFRKVHATLAGNLERVTLVVANPGQCTKRDRQAARAALERIQKATEQLGHVLAA